MAPSGSRQATFIVRMWTEGTRPGGGALWRGVVEYVQGGDHRAFQELDVALGFIEQTLVQHPTGEAEER